MNGTATTNGGGMVQLEINVPFAFTLKFKDGLLYPAAGSRYPESGDQMIFTLTNGQRLRLPVEPAAKIARLPGMDFIVVKKQLNGQRKIEWIVNSASIFPPDARAEVASAGNAPVQPAYDDRDDWGEPPPLREELRAGSAPIPAAPSEGPRTSSVAAPGASAPPNAQQQPSRMTAALMAAVDSTAAATVYAKAQGMTLAFNADEICRVAFTIYINACGGGR